MSLKSHLEKEDKHLCFVYNGGEEEPHNGKRESPKPDQRMKKSPHILPNTSHPPQYLGKQPPHRVTWAATLQSAQWQLGGQEVGKSMAWVGCRLGIENTFYYQPAV